MAEVKTHSCDAPGCEQLKKKSNQWWVIVPIANGLKLFPMINNVEVDKENKTLCGRECTQKVIEQWMNKVISDA